MRRNVFIVLSSVILSAFSCEDNLDMQSISGSWKVSRQNVSGELKSIIAPPDGASYTDISIVIPDSIGGTITGNTFNNNIWVGFEIRDEQQIIFKNYGGTRILEDEYGGALRENLLNSVKFNISIDKLLFIDSQGHSKIELVKN